jgi:cytochrome c oxidase accessory protein FixG
MADHSESQTGVIKPGSRATLIDTASRKHQMPDNPEDPDGPLYQKRRQIYPKLAHGRFRTLKWIGLVLMLGAYYLVPWLRWDRGEGKPNQAVLADFDGERLYFFGIELWPQEVYYITGLLVLAALALFLLTSLFGRVWCGYACPQTVWTDLFIVVERFFEGDRAARMRLDKAPMSANKAWRKTGKHAVWLLIAFATGGALILYFHDAPSLARDFFAGEAPMTAYFFAGVLTFTTYMLAGQMREQVCTYMCPWPRIQGALTDKHALNVTYRYDRGEPRSPHRKDESWEGRGDCIDCKQCVQVCPMGIDIRNGTQLECIHCALCIDACDTMMKQVGRPTGLIAYDTEVAVKARSEGKPYRYSLIRARTVLYAVLFAGVGLLMAYGLATRESFELNVLKDRSPPFVRLSEGGMRNGYEIKIVNKAAEDRSMRLDVSGFDGLTIKVIGASDTEAPSQVLPVSGNGVTRYRVLVTHPGDMPRDRLPITISVTDVVSGETHADMIPFTGQAER